MEYEVVFDASQKGADWYFPALGLFFVAVGVALWLTRDVKWLAFFWSGPLRKASLCMGFAAFSLGFSIFWAVISSSMVFGAYCGLPRMLREGDYAVVEGKVQQFHPMPKEGHDTERFVVDGVHFEYSDYQLSPAFNQTSSHGGPVREGLQVRIHYVGDRERAKIVKLEVQR